MKIDLPTELLSQIFECDHRHVTNARLPLLLRLINVAKSVLLLSLFRCPDVRSTNAFHDIFVREAGVQLRLNSEQPNGKIFALR